MKGPTGLTAVKMFSAAGGVRSRQRSAAGERAAHDVERFTMSVARRCDWYALYPKKAFGLARAYGVRLYTVELSLRWRSVAMRIIVEVVLRGGYLYGSSSVTTT